MVSHIRKKERCIIGLPLLLFALATIPYWGYITDDTFITLRYARNLASGHGFSFNPGQPSYGFTCPLWVMVLALFRLLGADLVLTAKVLGIAFGLSCLWVLYLAVRKMIDAPGFAFLVTLMFAYDPWFIRWSSSGMEAPLALLLIVLGFWFHVKEGDRLPVSSVLLGLATLARPEAGLFFALMVLETARRRERRGKVWQSLVGYLCIVVPWLIFSLVRLGALTPNTLRAKYAVPGSPSFLLALAVRAGRVMGGTYLPYLLLILIVVILPRFRSLAKSYLLPLGWVVLLPLFYIVGRFPPASRYLLLAFPFVVLLGFLSLESVSSGWTMRRKRHSVLALLLVVLGTNTYVGWFLNYPNCRAFAKGMRDSHIYIGEWLRENTAPDAIIAAGDIGAIGYYSERRILDLGALTNPELIPLVRSHSHREIIEHGLYLELAEADYLIDRTTSPFSLIESSGSERLYEPLFYRSTPTLGLATPQSGCYYSVYRVKRENLGSVEEN